MRTLKAEPSYPCENFVYVSPLSHEEELLAVTLGRYDAVMNLIDGLFQLVDLSLTNPTWVIGDYTDQSSEDVMRKFLGYLYGIEYLCYDVTGVRQEAPIWRAASVLQQELVYCFHGGWQDSLLTLVNRLLDTRPVVEACRTESRETLKERL